MIVAAGTYAEALVTQQSGVTIRAAAGEEVIVHLLPYGLGPVPFVHPERASAR